MVIKISTLSSKRLAETKKTDRRAKKGNMTLVLGAGGVKVSLHTLHLLKAGRDLDFAALGLGGDRAVLLGKIVQ